MNVNNAIILTNSVVELGQDIQGSEPESEVLVCDCGVHCLYYSSLLSEATRRSLSSRRDENNTLT